MFMGLASRIDKGMVASSSLVGGPGMLHKPYSVLVHYPLYCGALYIIYVGLGLLVGLIVFILHIYILYIGSKYSHFSHHSNLSCLVYSVHCVRRFLTRRGLISISSIHFLGVDYSLIIYFCYFYAISGTWLHNMESLHIGIVIPAS